jgi:acyl-CoA synthetase (AMP-forming)/AMP-acid ligase II
MLKGMKNWQHQLERHAQEQGGKPLYRLLSRRGEVSRQLTYQQVWTQANGMAQVLRHHFKAGDRLLLLFEPDLDFCLALWACFLAGMVAIPLYPPADPRMRERFLSVSRDAEARGILTTAAIQKKVRMARWFLPVFRRLHWVSIDTLDLPAPESLPEVPLESLALLQYTSGSTHQPKGVMLSHQNFISNSHMLDLASRLPGQSPEARCVSWLPLYHDMGLMCGVIQPVYFGAESLLMSPLTFLQKPLRWLQALSDYQGTYSSAPNFAYDFCVKRITAEEKSALDLSPWLFALNGAEPIQSETMTRFAEAFGPCGFRHRAFFPAYGLAESTVFVAGGPATDAPETLLLDSDALSRGEVIETQSEGHISLVSVGKVWGTTQRCIVNPETCELLPEGRVGEIWLQSDSVGMGYWKQDTLTATAFQARLVQPEGAVLPRNGWLRTGDLGFVKAENLYITGRQKDVIILHGENHYPQRFERLAEQAHPAFRAGCNAAVGYGVPEALLIVQEVRPGSAASTAEMEKALKETVSAATRVPVEYVLLVQAGQVPKTSSGKVRRSEVRLRYQKGKLKAWKT